MAICPIIVLLWLGKLKNNKGNPLQLKWLHKPVKILGIHVSHDEKGNNQHNFNHKLQNCKQIWTYGGHVTLHYLGEY